MFDEHWIHVYEKPKKVISGNWPQVNYAERYYGRYLAYDYKHKISAFGGDDTASARLMVPKSEAEIIFGDYVGNRVAVYADNPNMPIWEGMINRVSIEVNGIKLSRTLDGMYNVVNVKIQNTGAAPETTLTSEVTNPDSIEQFGWKQGTIDVGVAYANDISIANVMRDKSLNQLAWPQVSTVASGNQEFRCTIEMIGFYHTFDWDTRVLNDGAVSPVWVSMFQVCKYDGLGAIYSPRNCSDFANNGWGVFFNDRDDADFDITNASFTMPRTKLGGESALTYARKCTEPGNGTNDYVFGITRTVHRGGSITFGSQPNSVPSAYRRMVWKQANTDVAYTTNAYGDGRIYTISGSEIKGYKILPDRSIRISDLLLGWNKPGDPPNVAYIETVSYDGNTGIASWQTKDSLRTEDAFQLRKNAKSTTSRFGADPNYFAT